jgi:hypothetical protein
VGAETSETRSAGPKGDALSKLSKAKGTPAKHGK